MPTRQTERILFAALAAIVAAGAWLLVGGDGDPTGSPVPEVSAPAPDEPAAPPIDVRETAVGTSAVHPRVAGEHDTGRADAPLGAGATQGYLDVRIQPSASVVGRFRSGTLLVHEMLNPNAASTPSDRKPFARNFPVKPGAYESPIYVEAGPIPFSEYGYRVTLFAPEFNGSSQVVRVAADSWNPQVELTVTPPSTLALRFVDQRLDPWLDEEVTLVPDGEPEGRAALRATTDNFGTVRFDAVLAGEWIVRCGPDDVERITVQRPGFVLDDLDIGVQSRQITVPRGRTLTIEAFDVVGWGIEGVDVVATKIDTVENRRHALQTDRSGVARIEHVVPGTYQIDVSKAGFQRTSRNRFVVPADVDPEPVRFRMVRLR